VIDRKVLQNHLKAKLSLTFKDHDTIAIKDSARKTISGLVLLEAENGADGNL
jgi:hypothetical protein